MQVRNLHALTLLVAVLVTIDALCPPVAALIDLLAPDIYPAYETVWENPVFLLTISISILTVILFARWIYVAGENLVALGYDDLEFTPAARIWWYAVPFANFFIPYKAMRELWNVSHGNREGSDGGLLGTWWALWLAASFLGYFNGFGSEAITVLQMGIGLALAAAAIEMIRRIAEAQRQITPKGLAEIFS